MERCPTCRARLDGSDQCRRCGLELTLLHAVDRASDAAIGRAIGRLVDGDRAGAIRDLEQARRLSGDSLVPVLLAFARTLPRHETVPDSILRGDDPSSHSP